MRDSIGKIITTLSRNIQQELKEVVEPFGISVGEEPYFVELAHEDGITQEELTKRISVDKAATARMVKALEEKGLLIRVTDSDDRRNKRLYLTDKAQVLYESLVETLQKYNEKLTQSWSDEEYSLVLGSLQKLQSDYEKRKMDSL